MKWFIRIEEYSRGAWAIVFERKRKFKQWQLVKKYLERSWKTLAGKNKTKSTEVFRITRKALETLEKRRLKTNKGIKDASGGRKILEARTTT